MYIIHMSVRTRVYNVYSNVNFMNRKKICSVTPLCVSLSAWHIAGMYICLPCVYNNNKLNDIYLKLLRDHHICLKN